MILLDCPHHALSLRVNTAGRVALAPPIASLGIHPQRGPAVHPVPLVPPPVCHPVASAALPLVEKAPPVAHA